MVLESLHNPWMIAVWPGMGNVALMAGSYAVTKLEAKLVTELPAADLFDVEHVDVHNGVAKIGQVPRNLIFVHRDPKARHDLVVFIGEAQPATQGYGLCQRLLDAAARFGVERIFTFAAISTQLHPGTEPRVFGVVNQRKLVGELKPLEIEVLKEGQISGMNGLLLAAAAERDIPAICLMGEMPYFATAIPNPAAARAALEVFSAMSGVKVDLADLAEQAHTIDEQLVRILDRLTRGADEEAEEDEAEADGPLTEPAAEAPAPPPEPQLDLATRNRIEELFEQVRKDRGRGVELKRELDRLGVFKKYENRFLDLFRNAH